MFDYWRQLLISGQKDAAVNGRFDGGVLGFWSAEALM